MNRNRFLTRMEKEFKKSIFKNIVNEQVANIKSEIKQEGIPYVIEVNATTSKKYSFENIIKEQIPFMEKYLKIVDYSFGINNNPQRLAIQFNEVILALEHIIDLDGGTYLSMSIDGDEMKRTDVVNTKEKFEEQVIMFLKEMFTKAFSVKNILLEEQKRRENKS